MYSNSISYRMVVNSTIIEAQVRNKSIFVRKANQLPQFFNQFRCYSLIQLLTLSLIQYA